MTQHNTQITKPVFCDTIQLDILNPGGSSSTGIIRQEPGEDYFVQHMQIDIYDQKGLVTPDRMGYFTVSVTSGGYSLNWQNGQVPTTALKAAMDSIIWRGFTLNSGTNINILASHNDIVPAITSPGPDQKLFPPFKVIITFVGFKTAPIQ